MKKIFLLAAVMPVLLAAGCQGQGAKTTETVTEVKTVQHTAGQIVYIHIDSLLMDYNMAKDLQSEFRVTYEKAQKELANKQTKFERDFRDFDEKRQKGLATRSQLADMQEKLQAQELTYRRDAETLSNQLAEAEYVMNNKVFDAITKYLEEFNADKRYGMIISTNTSGPVLNADPSLSITSIVLRELNLRYDREKAAQ